MGDVVSEYPNFNKNITTNDQLFLFCPVNYGFS
jgi:hypothetical protein